MTLDINHFNDRHCLLLYIPFFLVRSTMNDIVTEFFIYCYPKKEICSGMNNMLTKVYFASMLYIYFVNFAKVRIMKEKKKKIFF